MYKPQTFIKVKGKLIQLGYDKYTQSAYLHCEEDMIALNNKFQNLVGYGFIQYLKELMAENPACKIRWDEDTIAKMSSMMNMEAKLIRDIVEYCIKELKILKKVHTWRELERTNEFYLIYPDFMEELIMLESKKIHEESEIRRNANLKEDGIKYERKIAYRKRLVQEIRDVLIYTPEIKKNANMFYPNMNVDELWEQFVQMCEDQYYRWHAELTHDNYAQVFYTYLNKITAKIVIPKD